MVLTSRRDFLIGIGAVAGVGLGGLFRASGLRENADPMLRPPGALAEDRFLAACIRCGQCAEVCPYDTINMVGMLQGAIAGTPSVDSRKIPCYLCKDHDSLLCIDACPTTALSPVADYADIRMGVAVIDESLCFAYNQVVCRACWHACPYPNQAIKFDGFMRPVVNDAVCIGCGLCDHACPTDPSSIPIRPEAIAVRPSVKNGGAA